MIQMKWESVSNVRGGRWLSIERCVAGDFVFRIFKKGNETVLQYAQKTNRPYLIFREFFPLTKVFGVEKVQEIVEDMVNHHMPKSLTGDAHATY